MPSPNSLLCESIGRRDFNLLANGLVDDFIQRQARLFFPLPGGSLLRRASSILQLNGLHEGLNTREKGCPCA